MRGFFIPLERLTMKKQTNSKPLKPELIDALAEPIIERLKERIRQDKSGLPLPSNFFRDRGGGGKSVA
jgi:hypothetical protein